MGAVSWRHREHRSSIASNRGEIAKLFIRDAATLLLCFCCAILLRFVQSCYDLATTKALPQWLCHLDIVNIGASATLRLCSWISGQLNAWFMCSPKVGVAILDSMDHLWAFSCSCNGRNKSYLPVDHSAKVVYVCLRVLLDRPRTVWPSASFFPGPNHPT